MGEKKAGIYDTKRSRGPGSKKRKLIRCRFRTFGAIGQLEKLMFWDEFVRGTLTAQQGAGEGRERLFVSLQATTTHCTKTNPVF